MTLEISIGLLASLITVLGVFWYIADSYYNKITKKIEKQGKKIYDLSVKVESEIRAKNIIFGPLEGEKK